MNATRRHTKQQNIRLILKTIYAEGPLSRADLARMTALTRPTVSSLVAELMDDQLVVETGFAESTGGKRPILLSVPNDAVHLLCLDLGNQVFRGAILDLRGNVVNEVHGSTIGLTGDAALELACEMVEQLQTVAARPLLGLGIGAPGLVDPDRGLIREAVNRGWHQLDLKARLAQRIDLPIYVANDSHIAALAEFMYGDPAESRHLILLKLGQGIGAGIVINGALFYGDGANAGEIGHVVVGESEGRLLKLEQVATPEVVFEKAIAINRGPVSWDEICRNPRFRPLIEEVGTYLGISIAHLVGGFNIRRIVISGRVSELGDPLLRQICSTVYRYALPRMAEETDIRFSQLGDDIVLKGCAAMVLHQELGIV